MTLLPTFAIPLAWIFFAESTSYRPVWAGFQAEIQLDTHFGISHSSLRSFLDWLQKCQYGVQCRELQPSMGRPPKQKLAKYQMVDRELMHAKVQYNLHFGSSLTSITSPEHTAALFHSSTLCYLSRVSHLMNA